MSLLIVGSVAFDQIETPYGKTGKILGGAGTYIGLAASRYIKPVHVVSVVGNDFPQEHLDLMKDNGINLDGLKIDPNDKTFFWAGKYHQDMNQRDTLVTELNVLAKFNPVVPEAAKDADFLMLGNLTPAIQIGVIKQMTKRPKLIVLDTMNFWMDSAWDDLMEVLTMIDVLTINDEEARQLSGKHSLVAAARKILTMGPKYLVVKKGEHGALLFSKDEMFSAPAMPLESVFDPTGAGDTFAGGFIGYLAKQNEVTFEHLRTALIHGSALASFTVEKFGTQRLQDVTDAELKNRLMDFHNLVRFSL